MPTQRFGFQEYAKGQFEEIKDILRTLNTTFMPREEVNLRLSEIIKTQANITETLATHAKSIELLRDSVNKQNWYNGNKRQAVTVIGGYSAGIVAIVLWILDKFSKHL